ncbi:MAG: hypothetical protein U5K71_14395 [Gracilimonas sp.]|nr:hypothetical protein [Gracilimonas sp.]
MKRKERNHTNKRQSSRTRRRGAESPIRDLPEEIWEVKQRLSEEALISFDGIKERGVVLKAGYLKRPSSPNQRPHLSSPS